MIHLALAADRQRGVGSLREVERQAGVEAAGGHDAEKLVSCIDFRYITDALTPDEAIAMLERNAPTKTRSRARAAGTRLPGLHDVGRLDGLQRRRDSDACAAQAIADGWTHFKVKVGGRPEDDRRRVELVRDEIGPDRKLMIDANQQWDVREAIERVRALADSIRGGSKSRPAPTTFSDTRRLPGQCGRLASPPASTAPTAIVFKQLLQARAIDFCQIDSCRLGGVNENLAVMLMAAKFDVPVCPHAGGVGLCEYVQHLSMFDYIAVTGTMEGRVIEYVDHLHEHFEDPVVIRRGRYLPPLQPGYSITISDASRSAFRFPDGPAWADRDERRAEAGR